jgi:D-beta-D-heptose 7-phosphate kinase/D-beta-D-heptose 1-phosphate adenosyltransferase
MDIQQQKKYKILLLGDNCIDEYQYGSVDRISPEAPVPIINYKYNETKPGMAGNVNQNLINLGLDVHPIVSEPGHKIRIIDTKSKQQLLRIDKDKKSNPLPVKILNDLGIEHFDAVVISDYNKGFISYEIIQYIRQNYVGPMFLDTKKRELDKFYDIYVKINEVEYKASQSLNNTLIVTLGNRGAMYKKYDKEIIFDVPKIEVMDVCGAGDTFLSALTYKFLHTKNMIESIKFANKASMITVQHMGNYAPTLEEIK